MIQLSLSERILILAGFGILVSVPLIGFGDFFGVWVAAKVLYGIGVLLFLVNK
jgi:hypothetical protein